MTAEKIKEQTVLNIKNFIRMPEPDDTLFADAAYLKSEGWSGLVWVPLNYFQQTR